MAKKRSCCLKAWRQKGAKLNALKFALAGGAITALCIFVVTITGMLVEGYAYHSTWILMEIYGFLGYKISLFGAVLGAIYSFIDGFILTWIFALIYNKLV